MIKYPTRKPNYVESKRDTRNRGMAFEALVDESNRHYLAHDKAVIHKKPTPVQIVGVDYPSRSQAKITEAYYRTPSTTDYNGIYKGRYIDFDVKESQSMTSFPLKNVHAHQLTHLKNVHAHGGVAFLLIYFRKRDTVHLLGCEPLATYAERAKKGRKSITYDEIVKDGYTVKCGFRPPVDYLKAVEAYIETLED